MVCFNNKLPIDRLSMKRIMLSKLDEILDNKLWYLEGVKDESKDKLRKSIIKEMENEFNSDKFIYLMIHDDHCTFKHRRGKNDGNFCCKRITKNGDKKNYVCREHNKNHIPRTKENIMKKEIDSKNDSIKIINTDNNISSFKTKSNNNYILKPKLKKNKKININSFNFNNFKKIINNYSEYNYSKNTRCKYDGNCNNNNCKYKHFNKEILINDFLYKNNININHIPILSF